MHAGSLFEAMFSFLNRIREIGSFWARYRNRERRFSSCHERGTKKKLPCEESNLRPSDSALRCSTTEPEVWGSIPQGDSEFFVPHSWQDEKTSFSIFSFVPWTFIFARATEKSPGCVASFWMLICFALFRFVIGLQVSRHPFNQSVAPLKLSTSGSVTSFCSRRRILTMASWGEHTVKVFLANGFWSSLIKMLFGLYCRMEWLQQGSRELFGTIIEDQVCAGFSLKHNLWS